MSTHGKPRTTYDPTTDYRPVIELDQTVLPEALRHGMELWWDDSTPKARLDQRNGDDGFTRFVNARIEGKMAERAFVDLLQRDFGVDSTVDYRIYGDYTTTDDGDLQHLIDDYGNECELGVDFDLKKTKPYNSWLAIRDTIYQKLDAGAPVILSMLRIEEDIDLEPWADATEWSDVETDDEFRERLLDFADTAFPLEVEFRGTVFPCEFTDYFEEGDRLYDPSSGRELGGPLRCDNMGCHVRDLNTSPARWNEIVSLLIGDSEISWNPLTVASDTDPSGESPRGEPLTPTSAD
ncbi:hypothetical protein [Halosegnis longus]|uniref:hypothetical protein n=1 Tax=Halosegnis longus TaxID=2216012 RepID=UPI00129DC831|nr:hypothetical protein [Halosegnis longus]